MPRRLLLITYGKIDQQFFCELADSLLKISNYKIFIFKDEKSTSFDYENSILEWQSSSVLENSNNIFNLSHYIKILKSLIHGKSKLPAFPYQILQYFIFCSFLTIPFQFLSLLRRKQNIKRELKKLKPDVVIISKLMVGYDTYIWVSLCKKMNIKTVLMPFDIADTSTLAQDRLNKLIYSTKCPENYLLSKLDPKWCLKYQGQKLILLPFSRAVCHYLIAGPFLTIWRYNDLVCDANLLESQNDLNFYMKNPNKDVIVEVTGRVTHDNMHMILHDHDTNRNILFDYYKFKKHLPLVLVSIPPRKDFLLPTQEFSSYLDILKTWLSVINQPNIFNTLITFHPSSLTIDKMLAKQAGLAVSNKNISSIMPLVDCYVVDSSATSRLAASVGIPILDYDVYELNLPFNKIDYNYTKITTVESFRINLSAWVTQNIKSKKIIRAHKTKYGLIDGRASIRILKELNNLMVD